jgi:23S rRNA (uracil1939-C5)-methyltransferase
MRVPIKMKVTPERFVAGGEAIGHDSDGRVLFVKGGIPGDSLAVVTVEEKKDWSRVVVDAIERPSEMRVVPPCRRRLEGCGGCDWQHVGIHHQLSQKVEIVRDALRRTAKLVDADVATGVTVPDRGYRTTIRVVGDSNGRPSFRREGSHETVLADGCIVAHPHLRELLGSLKLTPGLEAKLRVSAASGEVNAIWDDRQGEVSGLPDHVSVGRTATITEEVAGHTFRVSSGSFFQSGPAAAAVLVEAVREAAPELDDAELVVDAYAGVGLFGVAASGQSAHIVAIESARSSADDCHVNLAGRNSTIERKRVENWQVGPHDSVDVVVADPSRTGLGRGGVDALVASRAPVFVLVSCDPVAMARDASLLIAEGYEHRVSEVHDLFPHTHHVECVTRFTLR